MKHSKNQRVSHSLTAHEWLNRKKGVGGISTFSRLNQIPSSHQSQVRMRQTNRDHIERWTWRFNYLSTAILAWICTQALTPRSLGRFGPSPWKHGRRGRKRRSSVMLMTMIARSRTKDTVWSMILAGKVPDLFLAVPKTSESSLCDVWCTAGGFPSVSLSHHPHSHVKLIVYSGLRQW